MWSCISAPSLLHRFWCLGKWACLKGWALVLSGSCRPPSRGTPLTRISIQYITPQRIPTISITPLYVSTLHPITSNRSSITSLTVRTGETARRIRQLRAYLQTSRGRRQQNNNESPIRLFESGELQPPRKGDPDLFFVHGQRFAQDPIEDPSVPQGSPVL